MRPPRLGRTATLPIRIVGTGCYLPPAIQTAEDLAPLVGRSADWIRRRTGVGERRISQRDVAEMAALAGLDALGDGPPPDLVLNCGLTPAQLIPDTAPFVLQQLGLDGIPAFSIHASCLGFLAGLQTAAAWLAGGAAQRVLVVAAERGSVSRDLSEPESAVLIGDGAGAAVVEAAADGDAGVLAFGMRTFPAGAHLAEFRGAGTRRHPNDPDTTPSDNRFHMNGPRIYKLARGAMAALVQDVLADARLGVDDIDLVVPHQASGPALQALPKMGLPAHKVVDILDQFGNCIAASLPMALAHADAEGRLSRGDRILLLGTGAGVSVGAAVLRW